MITYAYDVEYVVGHESGHANAMSGRRFKDDKDDMVAIIKATLEEFVIGINRLEQDMATSNLNKGVFKKFKLENGINVKNGKIVRKTATAEKTQIEIIHNGSHVCISTAYRKQGIETLHDVQ